jgi:hypothetical protein
MTNDRRPDEMIAQLNIESNTLVMMFHDSENDKNLLQRTRNQSPANFDPRQGGPNMSRGIEDTIMNRSAANVLHIMILIFSDDIGKDLNNNVIF